MKTDEQFIKDLYGQNLDSQKEQFQDNYDQNLQNLQQQEQQIQQQTDTNLQRTEVEHQQQTARNQNADAGISAGAQAQAALSAGNQHQQNKNTLIDAGAQARAEIERQRQLRGQEYASAIAQAQARNDMEQAQMLYDAAKQEEQNFLAMQKEAGQLMAAKGDYSILNGLYGLEGGTMPAGGGAVPQSGALTVDEEQYLREIYGAKQEGEEAALRAEYEGRMSDLEAQRQERQRQTDAALNETYAQAARASKNYNEVMGAQGMSSGVMAQAGIARGNAFTEDMTRLRTLQAEADANMNAQGGEYYRQLLDAVAGRKQENDSALAQELYEARAQNQEQNLQLQLEAAELMAQRGDYSLLGQLYGLTPEQIARLEGRGQRKTQDSLDGISDTNPQSNPDYAVQPGRNPGYGANMGYGGEGSYSPGSNGKGVNIGSGANSAISLDESSVRALGLSGLSGEELAQMVNSGALKTTLKGNKVVLESNVN